MMDPLTLAGLGFLTLFFARGMVHRTATLPEQLRQHPVRDRIIEMLRREPGKNITGILRELGSAWGTVQHHLYLLERAGVLSSTSRGREHHYFHGKPEDAHQRRVALMRRGRVPQLLQLVLQEPGHLQQDLTERLGMSRKVFRDYMDRLVAEELVTEVREAKTRRYFATPALIRVAGEGALPPVEVLPLAPASVVPARPEPDARPPLS